VPLRIATGNYGLTQPLKRGAVQTGRLALEFVEVEAITTNGMRPMVRNLAFDICEMAFTTYLCARAAGKPLTAIPVFLTRNFHHRTAFTSINSGIKTPKDLEGRMVGVNRGYTVTTGLWIRGILQHEYGVDLEKITWAPTDEEHVAEFKAPRNVDHRYLGKPIIELLRSGELPAAVGDIRTDAPEVRPLIADARQAGFASFRKTGVYPINHGLVVQNAVLERDPWVAEELFRAFAAAKDIYLNRLRTGEATAAADKEANELAGVVGGDPFPFGLAPNHKALETLVDYAVEQHLIPAKVTPESLFAPSTLKLG
jgi:4,5-dihydroxyphthalate decarboxylase